MHSFPSARALIVGALLAPCGSATLAQAPPTGPVTVLRAARMVDTKKGVVVPNAVVLVQGGRIMAVGSAAAIPAGATVIDLGDARAVGGGRTVRRGASGRAEDDRPGVRRDQRRGRSAARGAPSLLRWRRSHQGDRQYRPARRVTRGDEDDRRRSAPRESHRR